MDFVGWDDTRAKLPKKQKNHVYGLSKLIYQICPKYPFVVLDIT